MHLKPNSMYTVLFFTSVLFCSTWHEQKVELQHIHMCHLIDYYSQLQSILLSHCHYSLRVGRGHDISYDLPALQKHLVDRFIFGRPRILVDIPHVSYQKDVYTTATFATVRKTVAQVHKSCS